MASCGEYQCEFVLGVCEPRPGAQPLVKFERGFEMLFGDDPFAHHTGEHAEIASGGAAADGRDWSENCIVTVRQQLLIEALGLQSIAQTGADLGQIRQGQTALSIVGKGKPAGGHLRECVARGLRKAEVASECETRTPGRVPRVFVEKAAEK